jgi:cyclase
LLDCFVFDEVNARRTTRPLIVLGEVGELTDFIDVFSVAGVSATSGASIFHFTDQSPIKAKFHLKSQCMNMR